MTAIFFPGCLLVHLNNIVRPLLFILGLEIYLKRLLDNPNIIGFEMFEKQIKYTAYGDDITCFCKDTESLSVVLENFQEFSGISGLCLNRCKSEGMWIGRDRLSKEKPQKINWADNGVENGVEKEVQALWCTWQLYIPFKNIGNFPLIHFYWRCFGKE